MSAPTPGEPLLVADAVGISFETPDGVVDVTRDISFEVGAGETAALVGESGSGKTVTAMSVLDLLPATAGRSGAMRYLGEDLFTAPAERIRRLRGGEISMIFQEPMTAFNPVYTVGRQISDAIRAHRPMSRAAALTEATRLLADVGIPEPARRVRSYPHQLSGGQRQRAMIAMAIANDPDLLIADEPTTALDVTVQAEILALLRRLQKERGMGILLITHDMGVVAEMADRVVVMEKGDVVEQAGVFELFAAPTQPYTQALLAAVPRAGSVAAPERAPQATDGAPALELQGLSVRYPGSFLKKGFLAVEDVSLTIPQGEVLALVGESGSGKSTIGKAVVGLVPTEGGELRIAGKDVRKTSAGQRRELRRSFAMVFQDPASSLNPRQSIGESIMEPFVVHRPEMGRAERNTRVSELLERVELPSAWHSRYPHELSGGQRQRIGIARALALEPALLIADEPTSALDVSVQAAVLELFRTLQRELGFSCLFISHDLAVVELLASEVAVLRAGRLVEQGATASVLRAPREEYTRRLVEAAPVPDPVLQRERAAKRLAVGN
ncbi:ABC transporter ATP-binding protein [Microbacterium marinilacus]|uniref:ABC transporter ATP-binding protein n=1 Tax=Microbacterium marinilacus TaxID=415209 RepID=A0ABP7BUK2_9MICO|nr:ABC transporter ATP-binding protein [Microbacterium marinilacus]MBY0689246.1 ABC transporter ATP-binding protein [Microbacterium marinilacus]